MRRRRTEPLHPSLRALRRRKLRTVLLATLIPLAIIIAAVGTVAWYHLSLRPLDDSDANHVRITVAQGTRAPEIGQQLKKADLIRSSAAFELYTRLSGTQNKLQAGTYAFAPNQSVGDIVSRLESGKTDEFSITIVPGQTLKQIRTMLLGHGYSAGEIDAAMNATYSNSILGIRSGQTSLEGFFYPDTYEVYSDGTLQDFFAKVFDEYAAQAADNNLAAQFAAHGLTLYQGITLASIVQKEVSGADQPKVASVFYNRLDADMFLGSDVTFIYGADLLGVTPSPKLDSPYNTYVVKGLPPTPISSPDLATLKATANPAQTDYLYFVAGDDGQTHFATTSDEHDANVKQYCKIKCQ